MTWIWQQKKWPRFDYDPSLYVAFEQEFHRNAGIVIGVIRHLESSDFEQLKIEILTQEALSTSGIEGEILQRKSVQSSIRKHLGLKIDTLKIPANAAGIAEMMTDVYLNFDKPLTHGTFFLWHQMLMNGRRDIESIGDYRIHTDAMQIVSGNIGSPKIFYEAPPSEQVLSEMEKFIEWYAIEASKPNGIPTVVLAGIAHLHFEIIHPFEDGNGRMGRALIEKIISQRIKTPALNSFSKVIEAHKKEYYTALQSCNHTLGIDTWLIFFSKMLLVSQLYTIKIVDFIVSKNKFFTKYSEAINERQSKVLLRIFEEGIEGFKGGLSAANYKNITNTSPATVTRDLQELVNINAFIKTGELKHSRYFLNLKGL
jgi:Fic family protein